MNWQTLPAGHDDAEWDDWLDGFDDRSIYQRAAWGRYRQALGWTAQRWAAFDGGRPRALAQGLLRRYPGGVGVVWLPGGPVGAVEWWNAELQDVIRRSSGLSAVYCRFNAFRPARDDERRQLAAAGWRPPRAPLGSGLSLLYDLSPEEDARLAACSRNWRHNLRRAGKGAFGVALWPQPDAEEMRAVYAEMEDHKQLAEQHSAPNLRALYRHVGAHLVTVACRDAAGRLLSFRACAILGDRAWDMLAATAIAGRKNYASYATFWALMQECRRRGVRRYDLSGVDPRGNRGVYDFKQGTGAAPLEYLGEWEAAAPRLLALPANWLIGRRRGAL